LARPLGFRDRGRLQRRARYLRHLREVQIRDLGGFVLELHRFGTWRGDLVGLKVGEAAATDRELRALESVLSEQRPLHEVREAGIGGACGHCGAIYGSVDRFCAACGTPVAATAHERERPETVTDPPRRPRRPRRPAR
jgi:NADH pyrophosphatase NudC (nudix superfamily)